MHENLVLSHTGQHQVRWFYVTAALRRVDFHHSASKAVKICCLVLWFLFLFVLNVTQRERALSRRTKETEAASNQENKYLYWYLYTLFCTLCNYEVSANLPTAEVYWDAILSQRRVNQELSQLSRERRVQVPLLWQRLQLLSREKDVKSDSAHPVRSQCSLWATLCSAVPVERVDAWEWFRKSVHRVLQTSFRSCSHLLLRGPPGFRGWSAGEDTCLDRSDWKSLSN